MCIGLPLRPSQRKCIISSSGIQPAPLKTTVPIKEQIPIWLWLWPAQSESAPIAGLRWQRCFGLDPGFICGCGAAPSALTPSRCCTLADKPLPLRGIYHATATWSCHYPSTHPFIYPLALSTNPPYTVKKENLIKCLCFVGNYIHSCFNIFSSVHHLYPNNCRDWKPQVRLY